MIRTVVIGLALACLLVGLQARAEVPTNTHGIAVIIGNKAYPGRTPDAEYAHNDATAMKKFAIERLGYRPGNIIDLRDATKGQMEAVFGTKETHKGKLFNWMRPGKSDVVVFYSGHGVPGLQDKRGYLLPVDGDPNLAEITGFPVDRLYANLAKLAARSVTVFLDACFSGETPKGMLVRATSGLTVTPRAPETARSLTVITAAQGDQFASWDEDAKHGLFTRHLLLALGGKADASAYGNGDGKVSLDEAKKYLDEEMTYQARRRYGREQLASVQGRGGVVLASYDPQQKVSLVPPSVQVEDMDASYVAVKTANVRAKPTTSAAKIGKIVRDATVLVTGRVKGSKWLRVERPDGGSGYVFSSLLTQADEAEISAWNKVRDTKLAGEVGAFLRRYPDGYFASRARQLKGALAPQVAAIISPKAVAPKAMKPVVGVYPKRYRPGDAFRDCLDCPEMIVIPSGRFRMGDMSGSGYNSEKPVHDVRINYSFAVGKFEVTQKQWWAFMRVNPSNMRGDNRPVGGVRWNEAKTFVERLSKKTGKQYRLLSEAEWEYAARAGTTTKYHWGSKFDSDKVAANRVFAEEVGSYVANAFGLHDMLGNVWEWVEDCWHGSYLGAPADGSAWVDDGKCRQRSLRGSSWNGIPKNLRAAYRSNGSTRRSPYVNQSDGFRVARTLSSGQTIEQLMLPKSSPPRQTAAIIPPKITKPKPVKTAVGVYSKRYRPGDGFRDCPDCPEMVVMPKGTFMMGAPSAEREWYIKQGGKKTRADGGTPRHSVNISYEFAVGKFEVTRGQYEIFVADHGRGDGDGCTVLVDGTLRKEALRNWRSPGFAQTDNHPVACMSWHDARAYVDWLSRKTGETYRLMSEAEWEYAARAGTSSMRYWGHDWNNAESCAFANVNANLEGSTGLFDCSDGYTFTAPIGEYRPNAFGLYDMLGNLWEWTEDCWHKNYKGSPADGSAWRTRGCKGHIRRGGSWLDMPRHLRAASRYGLGGGTRFSLVGFRVARTLSR
jgi:formylglycine-generating enzyme required for sulfatase activity